MLGKSGSWHVGANASHRPVIAKLHGKHSLARSLEIRLIVAQEPQGGRKKKKKQCCSSEYHCTPWLYNSRVKLKQTHWTSSTGMFPLHPQLLGGGIQYGSDECAGSSNHRGHGDRMVKRDMIDTCRFNQVSDSTTLNSVSFFWNNFCLEQRPERLQPLRGGQKHNQAKVFVEVQSYVVPGPCWGHSCGNVCTFVFCGAMLPSSAGHWHFPEGLTSSMWPFQKPRVSAAQQSQGIQPGCLSKLSSLGHRNKGIEQSAFFLLSA